MKIEKIRRIESENTVYSMDEGSKDLYQKLRAQFYFSLSHELSLRNA